MVEAAQQVHPEARPVLDDRVGLRHAAGHRACLGPGLEAVLVHPVEGLARRDVGPAGREGRADGGQRLVAGRLEGGEQEHRRIGVEGPVLAARVQPAPPVEDAPRFGGHGKLGDGVEEGLHG